MSVPLVTEKKRVSETFSGEKSIIFFTKEIKISKGSRNLPSVCDIIERKERIMLFGRIPLPIWIKSSECVCYDSIRVVLSEEEALEVAREQLYRELSLYECISAKETVLRGEGSLALSLTARVREEISLEIKMTESEIK